MEKDLKIIDLNLIFNNIFYTPTLCSFIAKIMDFI